MKSNYPVAIVGGGLAGATLALALSKAGIECVVFEAYAENSTEQPSFDDRTLALSEGSLQIFDSLGLKQKVLAAACSINEIHISDRGHFGFARLSAQELHIEQLGMVIENWQLGKILLEAVKQEPQIDYFFSSQVVDLEQSQQQARLKIVQNNSTEQLHSVDCELVVLADGARSPLRQNLKIETEEVNYQKSALVCNIQTQLPHKNQAFERFTTDGPLALLPLSGNRMSLVWSKPHEQIEECLQLPEAGFAMRLESEFGARLGRITKVGKRSAFPLIQQKALQRVRGRCVLIANSAQSLHPIAGQGFNLGLRDIEALSQTLFMAQQQVNTLADYSVLRHYQEIRAKDREQTLFVTESLARLFANNNSLLSCTRNLLLKAMDIVPLAKEEFARKAMGLSAVSQNWQSSAENFSEKEPQ